MADLGKTLDLDMLTLVTGRDFEWTVDHTGGAGELFLELDTGGEHNAIQTVDLIGATGGNYRLGVSGQQTAAINFYTATSNPYSMSDTVRVALEALSTVGVGNVAVQPAKLFPVWEIGIKLNAGRNEIQMVDLMGYYSGGSFKLGLGSQVTDHINFGAEATLVEQRLGALSAIGAGNVKVTKVSNFKYRVEFVGTKAATNMPQLLAFGGGLGWGLTGGGIPHVVTSTVVHGLSKLTEPLVDVLTETINDMFNSFKTLGGVNLEIFVTDSLNAKVRATSLKSYVEKDLITFSAEMTGPMIQNAVSNIAEISGLLDTTTVAFYWNHQFQVEFIKAQGLKAIPKMTATSSLTGLSGVTPRAEVNVIMPGKARMTKWPFTISSNKATVKVASTEADTILPRTRWQLVFKAASATGGVARQIGLVFRQPR